jgi:hypothetical protein
MSSPSSDKIRLQTEGLQTNKLPLLSNLAQSSRTQRKAPPPDESLLNQQSSVAASAQARQLTAMAGFPLVHVPQLIPPLSQQSSLLGQLLLASIARNRTGFPLDSQMPMAASQVPLEALSLTPSLMRQLQLVLIAQNRTSFERVPQQQIPALQAPSPPYQTSPLLVQMQLASMAQSLLSFPPGCTITHQQQIPAFRAPSPPLQTSPLLLQMQLASMAQSLTGFPIVPKVLMTAGSPQQPPFLNVNQSSYLPPAQSASALAKEYFLQRPSASQNPPFIPKAQNKSHELQIVQESNRIKDQLPALLLSHQRAGGTNTKRAGDTNTTIPGMIQSSANQTELFLRALAANASSESKLRKSIQGDPEMATTAGVSAFHHSLPSPIFSNKYNMGLDSSEASSSGLALQGHVHDSSRTQEKRWMIRYEELIQFRQVRNICDTRQSFPLSRFDGPLTIPVVLRCFSLSCLISR